VEDEIPSVFVSKPGGICVYGWPGLDQQRSRYFGKILTGENNAIMQAWYRSILKKICSFILVFIVWPCHAGAWTGNVAGVIDGDSLKILQPGQGEVEVRLYGIDAPEFKQDFGRAAQKHLAALLSWQEIEVETLDKDTYGRSVVVIRLGGMNVNERMVRDGFAWVYRHYCREPFCGNWLILESKAREEKRGLWQQGQPVPPWEFRHGK